MQLFHLNVWDTMLIAEKGTTPHPRTPLCAMLVPWEALNGRHSNTTQCENGAEKKRRRLSAEEVRASKEWAFRVYYHPLTSVFSFKYLGRIIMVLENDWPMVVDNLRRSCKKWVRLSRILGREGVKMRVSRTFFKEVLHAVLLFGSKTLVMTSRIGRALIFFSAQGGLSYHGKEKTAAPGWKLGVPPPPLEGSNVGGGDTGSGGARPEEEEYCRTVYLNAADYISL